MAKPRKTRTVERNALTGRFVPKGTEKKKPAQTVRERVPIRKSK